MTAEPLDGDGSAVAPRLEALDDVATPGHLAVYTAIAGELAARLDHPDEQPKSYPNADRRTGGAAQGDTRG